MGNLSAMMLDCAAQPPLVNSLSTGDIGPAAPASQHSVPVPCSLFYLIHCVP